MDIVFQAWGINKNENDGSDKDVVDL